MKGKKKIFIIAAIVVVVVVVGFIFFVGGGAELAEEEEAEQQAKYDNLVYEAETEISNSGDYELAFNDLKEAIEIDSEREEAYLDIIDLCIDSIAYDEARDYLNQALEGVGETDALYQKEIKLDGIENGYVKDNPILYFEGHKYEVWQGFYTIEDANDFFKSIGGYAASITSKEEDAALYGLYQDCSRTSLYFGLVEGSVEGDYRWLNGESVTYLNWGPGEPNNNKGNESVGSYYQKYDGQWNDSLPNNESYIICEYDY